MKTAERKALAALFFLFGFGVISWLPRFPEVKHKLHLSDGQFGTAISVGSIGSLIGLLTVGHLVHHFGTRKSLTAGSALLFGSLALIVNVDSTWEFVLCNIAVGMGISAFHLSINGQAFHEQSATGENLIPRLHGIWSAGALATAILSGFLTGRVPLALHIDILMGVLFLATLFLLAKLAPSLLPGSDEPDGEYSLRTLISSFNIDWVIAIGLTCATVLEFATGDWAAIFAKEDLHMSAGVSAIPFILMTLAMIIGRLTVHYIIEYIEVEKLIRRCVIIGGATSAITLTLGVQVSKYSPTFGFVIVAVGTFIAGLGASFLAPTFMNAANHRSLAPGSVVLGQLGVVTIFLIFVLKSIIAWTAQLTSIAVALLIPSFLLMAVIFSAKVFKKVDV